MKFKFNQLGNITVTAKSTYDSKEKFSGEIGGRIAF